MPFRFRSKSRRNTRSARARLARVPRMRRTRPRGGTSGFILMFVVITLLLLFRMLVLAVDMDIVLV